MFDQIRKAVPLYLKSEYPLLIFVVLLGIASEVYAACSPELAGNIELAATATVFVAAAIRSPFSHRKLTEALKNA